MKYLYKFKKGKRVKMTPKEVSQRKKDIKSNEDKKRAKDDKNSVKFGNNRFGFSKEKLTDYIILINYLSKDTDKIDVIDLQGKKVLLTKTKLIELSRKATEKYLNNLI